MVKINILILDIWHPDGYAYDWRIVMPLWLTILCSTGIVGLIIKEIWCGIKASTKKAKDNLKRQKQEEMREVIQEEIKPLEQRISKIEENTENSLKADVVVLRCEMKNIRDKCKKELCADIGDKVTMKELYEKYKDLGGNHFKEYVNQWLTDVEALPEEREDK